MLCKLELCTCSDCMDSERPCANDCGSDNECAGCTEAREEREDVEFAIDCETGRL